MGATSVQSEVTNSVVLKRKIKITMNESTLIQSRRKWREITRRERREVWKKKGGGRDEREKI
jgi:hypothetical protein